MSGPTFGREPDMAKQNRVSVKSVTAQQGHDGIGWRCRVYLDGKMLKGWCVEDGYGGGLYFNGAEPSTNDALDEISEIAIDGDPQLGEFMPKSAWEALVSDLVGDALEEKDMMRRTTKEVWFQLEGEDPSTVRTFKRRHKISGPNCAGEEAGSSTRSRRSRSVRARPSPASKASARRLTAWPLSR